MSQFQKFFAIAAVGLLTLAALRAESTEDKAEPNHTEAIVAQAEAFWDLPEHKWDAWMEERAEEWLPRWEAAAEAGLAEAQFFLIRAYHRGLGVEENHDKAFRWAKKGAEEGYAPAQNYLGTLYWFGHGVVKDMKSGTAWIRKAAEQGLYLAARNLGNAYRVGRGVEKDWEQALAWYKVAAEQGDFKAQEQAAKIFQKEGMYERAVDSWRAALSSRRKTFSDQPDNASIAEILFYLGNALHAKGQSSEARKSFKKVISILDRKNGKEGNESHHFLIAVSYQNLARIAFRLGNTEKALQNYLQATDFYRSSGSSQRQNILQIAHDLSWSANTLSDSGKYKAAKECAEAAMRLLREVDYSQQDPLHFAASLMTLVNIYRELEDFENAYSSMRECFDLVKSNASEEDVDLIMLSLGALCEISIAVDKAQVVLDALKEVEELLFFKGANKLTNENKVKYHFYLGKVHRQLGDTRKAITGLSTAIKYADRIIQGQQDYKLLAQIFADLGRAYQMQGHFDEAVKSLVKEVEIREQLYAQTGDLNKLVSSMRRLSIAYLEVGQKSNALVCAKKAYVKALSVEGLNQRELFYIHSIIGSIYQSLFLYENSELFFLKALELAEGLDETHLSVTDIMSCHINLMAVYSKKSELDKAKRHMAHVIEMDPGKLPEAMQASFFLNIAEFLFYIGDDEFAEKAALTALSLTDDFSTIGYLVQLRLSVLDLLSKLKLENENFDQVRKYSAMRLDLSNQMYTLQENPESFAVTFTIIARLLYASGSRDSAVILLKRAVNLVQLVRHRRHSNGLIEDRMQYSFVDAWEPAYRRLADWLVEAGRFSEAQLVLSMLKEQEYFRQLSSSTALAPQDTEADHLTIPLTPGEQEAYAPVEALNEQISKVAREAHALRAERKQKGGELPEPKAARLAELEQELDALNTNLAQAREQMAQKLEELAATNPTRLRSGDQSYAKLLRQLRATGAEARLLSYIVGEDGITWFLIQPDAEPLQGRIAMGRGDLNRKILTFHRQLADPHSNPRPLSRELYELLLAPVREALDRESVDTLLLSLDYNLRRIPFACLHDGEQYLVESFQLARFSEQGKFFLDQALREGGQRSALPETPALAVGVSEAHAPFEALPAVRDEIDAVVLEGIEDPRGILRGQSLLDEAFTLDRFREALATCGQAYRNSDKTEEWVLHLATHFALDPLDRGRSYLLLGDGGRLSFSEIAKGALSDGLGAFPGVDLIVLSACDTAMERPRDDGRSIDSLAILAHKQQAQGVMATLWPVIDQTTPAVMELFYHERFRNGLNKAEALRQAQLACLQTRHQSPESILTARYDNPDSQRPGLLLTALTQASATSPEATRRGGEHWKPPAERNNSQTTEPTASPTEETKNTQYPGFSHPAYWAPFVLIGDFL